MIKCTLIIIFIVVWASSVGAGSTFPRHHYPPLAPNWKIDTYKQIAGKYAKRYGIPVDVYQNLIFVESSWNRYAVSNKGAIGLSQVMPATARHFGVSPHLLFHPVVSLRTGAMVLSNYRKRCKGSLEWAVMAYNAGPSVCKYADNILGGR